MVFVPSNERKNLVNNVLDPICHIIKNSNDNVALCEHVYYTGCRTITFTLGIRHYKGRDYVYKYISVDTDDIVHDMRNAVMSSSVGNDSNGTYISVVNKYVDVICNRAHIPTK